ncbi:hypothetical protein Q1695_005336 [Nippostrongylus brasiliensis]|nr:hypothetical protein Q1695_005336 [Nippostrongylus brasiliensis]
MPSSPNIPRVGDKKAIWKNKEKEDADNIMGDLPTTLTTTHDQGNRSSMSRVSPMKTQRGSVVSERSLHAMDYIPEDNRYKWCMRLMSKSGTSVLRKEFMKHKKYKPAEYTYEACKRNETKNRYDDVICIDATRVILKYRPPDDDYIHANWMNMPDGQKYICTQGPLPETILDFWHMIFTEKNQNEKCALYHPKVKTECGKFGPYRVYLKEIKAKPFNSVRHLVLFVKKDQKTSMLVNHLSCTDWPDHTAPMDAAPIVGMLKLARELSKGTPIIVHCSAGIGRSATFVGIDYAMQKIRDDSNTTMVEVLRDLRNQRFQSIQGIIQYIFLHVCVLEGFADAGVIKRSARYTQFMNDYRKMLTAFNKRIAAKMKKDEK